MTLKVNKFYVGQSSIGFYLLRIHSINVFFVHFLKSKHPSQTKQNAKTKNFRLRSLFMGNKHSVRKSFFFQQIKRTFMYGELKSFSRKSQIIFN